MRLFFALFLFAHVLSASAGKQAVAGFLHEAIAADLTDLCSADKVDYNAISAKMRKGPYYKNDVEECIEVFCERNDVRGLKAIHSVPATTIDKYFDYGLLRATMSGSVNAIKFYVERANIGAEDFVKYAKMGATSGHLNAVRYFLSHKEFPRGGDSGQSISMIAVTGGRIDIVCWILDEYMKPSQKELYSVASRARSHSRWGIIGVVIQRGFSINNDALGFYMPVIRNTYNAWLARHAARTEAAEGHFPTVIARIVADFGD